MTSEPTPILRRICSTAVVIVLAMTASVRLAAADDTLRYYLIGNSLTWDTMPSKLDGQVEWHVDCGKSLPYVFAHPEKPCVKSSKLWPDALKAKQYDFLVVQPHYGSTLQEDVETISKWAKMQPNATLVIHTGWARQETRAEEYASKDVSGKLVHSPVYFRELIRRLKRNFPRRDIRQTHAIDLLDRIAVDIRAGRAPFASLADLHRDKIHMKLDTGRYLMHNAMRLALGQPPSADGFPNIDEQVKTYVDRVLSDLQTERTSAHRIDGLEDDFAYDKPDQTIEAKMMGGANEYEGDVASIGDAMWFTWLEFIPDKGDRLFVGTGGADKRTSSVAIGRFGSYSYARPTLTVDSRQQLWLSYEVEVGGQWDVFAQRLKQGKPVGEPIRVSPAPGADIRHRVAADSQGGLWFVWQSDRGGQFDVVARRVDASQQGEVETVSSNIHGDWHPDVAVDGEILYVVWDRFDGTSYDVVMRVRTDQGWKRPVMIASGPAFQGRAEVVVDPRHRVWVAWEEGGENWGRPFRGISTLALTDDRGPLHRHRRIMLAMIGSDGRVHPAVLLPMPSRTHAAARPLENSRLRYTGSFYERPRLTVDSSGRIWLAYRHFYCPWIGIKHRSHVEAGWGLYARYLSQDGWSKLYRFSIGQGDGLQSLELVPYRGGIAAVWTTGRTHRTRNRRPRGIVATTIDLEAADEAPESPQGGAIITASSKTVPRRSRPEPAQVGGTEYRLFYGDLHRHTDLSLCRVPTDGTMDDAYRYAIDVAQLDFLGITDHSRDIAQGDALSLLWWRCRKNVTMYELAETFYPLFSYERSHSNTADHNVISLKPDLLRPHTYPVPTFWKELDNDTITIPHQPIRRDTWKYQDDRLRPLVEIFQGCRDNSIEEDVHRGLAKGYHLGFIASSDHQSTSASYACVWARGTGREAIFRSLQARRTFAATTNIRLVVTAGDQWMGEQIAGEKPPTIELKAEGTTPFRAVSLVVDGKVRETVSPNQRRVSLRRTVRMTVGHYVYFHLVQADGNEAWSSPIWLPGE